MFQMYPMVFSVSNSIVVHQVYQDLKVIKKCQMYIKCIKEYQVYKEMLNVSYVY